MSDGWDESYNATPEKTSGFGNYGPSGFGSKSSGFAGNASFGAKSGFGVHNSGISGFGENSGRTGFRENSGRTGFGEGKAGGSGFGIGSQGGSGFCGGKPGSGFSGGNAGGAGFGSAKSMGAVNSEGFGAKSGSYFGGGNTGNFASAFGSGGEGTFGRERGERNNNCMNCQQPGHQSRDCPEPRKSREGGAPRNCFNCQQPGHTSRECTEEPKSRETFSRGKSGFVGGFGSGNDGGFGVRKEGFGSGFGGESGGFGEREQRGPMRCFNCREEGHRSSDCPEPQGHRSTDYSNATKSEGVEGLRATYVPEEVKMDEIFSMQKIKEGLMFDKFFDAEVHITSCGKSIRISPCKNFSEASLTDTMRKNVNLAGYSKTTPIQQYALPLIRDGYDIMACAQTGSGKTAAFLLPIMSRLLDANDLNTAGEGGCYPRCIILTPTRELADQIHNEGRKFAYQTMMEIKPVYGGLSVGYNKSQIEKGSTIVVGTVGRIKHFCEEGIIKLEKCRFLVLDEADRMIDSMGFGNDIQKIVGYEKMANKENRQTLMFSATYPDSVQEAARDFLRENYAMITIDKIGAANKCVVQEFERCERSEKKDKLLELLGIDIDSYTTAKDADVYTKKTIVFVSQRAMADTLAGILSAAQVPAITIHGAREQRERSEALRHFRNGTKPVLIATAVAERGLDIKGVDHVINYDMPDSIDDYIHRIGRTGRVGNSGRATSFISEEFNLIPDLLKVLADAEQNVPDWMLSSCARGFGNIHGAEDEVW